MTAQVLWADRDEFMAIGARQICEGDIVLDIGCGIRPQNYVSPVVHICCEPYQEYVDVLLQKTSSSTDTVFVVVNCGWEEALELFAEKSVDTVFLLDVIEHVDKETGARLLALTERIARKQLVVFTPLGFVPQHTLPDGRDAWGLSGAQWQEHKSGWLPEDFGDDWDIVACEDFHTHNNIGEAVEEPFGALWAFRNIQRQNSERDLQGQVQLVRQKILDQGRKVLELLHQQNVTLGREKVSLQEENLSLRQDKVILEQENTELEHEKALLKHEKTILENEKAELEREKAVSEGEKAVLERDNSILEEQKALLEREREVLFRESQGLKKRYAFFEMFRAQTRK